VGGMGRNHGSDVSRPERMMELTMELSKPAENWVMSGCDGSKAMGADGIDGSVAIWPMRKLHTVASFSING